MTRKATAVLILALLALTMLSTAARAEGVPAMDPRTYTAAQFISDAESKENSERLGLAVLWGYGYICGKDESFIQPLGEALIENLSFKYMVVCKERPDLNLIQATQEVMRLSEALKRPAAPAAR